jgi:hypothetical protein
MKPQARSLPFYEAETIERERKVSDVSRHAKGSPTCESRAEAEFIRLCGDFVPPLHLDNRLLEGIYFRALTRLGRRRYLMRPS